jgi:hypothetical protein
MPRTCFDWQGVEHWTGFDLMETLILLDGQDEADDFMTAYADVCEDDEHALHNVTYLIQMIATDSDSDTAQADAAKLVEYFGIDYPGDDATISPRQWWKGSSLGVKVPA